MTLSSNLPDNTMCCDKNERQKQCYSLTLFFRGKYSMPNVEPIQHLVQIFEWFIGTIVLLFAVWRDSWTDAAKVKPTQLPREDVKINRTHLEPCIKEMDLYELQNISHLNYKINSSKCPQHTVVVWKLPHSNLILVAANTLYSGNEWPGIKITQTEVIDSDIFCRKANNELAQKNPETCVGRGNESQMLQDLYNTECGCNSQLHADIFLILICWCLGMLRSTEH